MSLHLCSKQPQESVTVSSSSQAAHSLGAGGAHFSVGGWGKGGEKGVAMGGGLGGRHGRDQKRGKVEWVNGGRHGMLLQEHIDL